MAIIREPDDIDLVFDPVPPTEDDFIMISDFIRRSKADKGVVTLENPTLVVKIPYAPSDKINSYKPKDNFLQGIKLKS